LAKAAERFIGYDQSLQDLTFDCIMALSKICMLLNQVCRNDETLFYDMTTRGKERRDEFRARKEHQELLSQYVELLVSTRGTHQETYGDRLLKFAKVMREIQIDMS